MARKLIVEVVADPRGLTRGLREAESQTRRFGHEMESATRGAAAGSGVFSRLGRSIAFASGSFLTFAAGTAFLKDSITAAQDAAMAQRSLAAQMKTSGESFAANKDRIDETAKSYARFGFNNDEVVKSLAVLDRGTRSIDTALKLQQVTADISAAKQIGLADAAAVVAKVFGGQETALRRAVPGLEKNAHGWDLIREAQQRVAGQAEANTNAFKVLEANIHDLKESIGNELVPYLNKAVGALNKFFEAMKGPAQVEMQKPVESTLVPAVAARIARMRQSGMSTADILTSLKRSPKYEHGEIWNEIISEALRYDRDPALRARLATQNQPSAITRRPRPMSLQGRFNLAELSLSQAQLTKTLSDDRRILVVEKAILEQQIAGATTLKEKTQLTQQLVGVQGQIQSIDQQNLQTKKAQTEELKKQAQALKTQADAIKSALLAQLQNRQTRINDQRAIEDAQRALHTARLIGGPQGIRAAVRAVDDARRQALIDRVSAAPARLRKSGEFSLGNVVTINVHGVTDPEKVARLVAGVLQRRARHTTTQQRGPATAAAGPH